MDVQVKVAHVRHRKHPSIVELENRLNNAVKFNSMGLSRERHEKCLKEMHDARGKCERPYCAFSHFPAISSAKE